MIRVIQAPEPASFHNMVRLPGIRAIAEMVGEAPLRHSGKSFRKVATERHLIPPDRFPPYWTEALDDLRTAYYDICAYSCFRIHPVTGAASVDHMAAKSRAWDRVYEWDNYRLACSRVNARKGVFADVLDPFEVHDDWFHLELVGFQVIPSNAITDMALHTNIQDTVDQLRLNDNEFRYRRASGSFRLLVAIVAYISSLERARSGRALGIFEYRATAIRPTQAPTKTGACGYHTKWL